MGIIVGVLDGFAVEGIAVVGASVGLAGDTCPSIATAIKSRSKEQTGVISLSLTRLPFLSPGGWIWSLNF